MALGPAPQVAGSCTAGYMETALQEHSPTLAFIILISGDQWGALSSALYATSLPKACAPTETVMHPSHKISFPVFFYFGGLLGIYEDPTLSQPFLAAATSGNHNYLSHCISA